MKNSIIILAIFSLGIVQSYAQTADSLKSLADKKRTAEHADIKEISRDSLLSSDHSIEELLSTTYHITSFKLAVFETGGTLRNFSNNHGDMLIPVMLNEIKSAPQGSVVAFKDVECVDKNNVKQKLAPKLYRIK